MADNWPWFLGTIILGVCVWAMTSFYCPSIWLIVFMAMHLFIFTALTGEKCQKLVFLMNTIFMASIYAIDIYCDSIALALVPLFIAFIFHGVLEWRCYMPLLVMILGAIEIISMVFVVEYVETNKAKMPQNARIGVVKLIEKRDYNEIMVVLEESDKNFTILPFDSYVEDAWRLEEGDTISYNVYRNEIVSFTKM